jgi:HSP20 family molecular chaperone IbpA
MAFELCCGVDGDGVRATMKSKLLHLCLPKAATEKQMKIKIETAV